MAYGKDVGNIKSLKEKRSRWHLHRAGLGSKIVEPEVDAKSVEKKAKKPATKKKTRKSKAKKSSEENADTED